MRRVLISAVVIACAGVAMAALASSRAASNYRVDAIFDTAQGIVAGQVVKVAGAQVGTVQSVRLTVGPKARMALAIDRRFAPFRTDASCQILPASLIGENYVECDPGTATARLPAQGDGVPTIAVTHTTEPVSLQDTLEIFAAPANERLRLLVNELGIATAGEGENINAILLRANPALAQARRILAIVDAQRRQVGTAVDQTDQIIDQLAQRDAQLRRFVTQAAAVAQTTGTHRQALGEGVRLLPGLLASVRSSFAQLGAFSRNATPVLAGLRASAPALTNLTSTLPPFLSAATPGIRALGSAAEQGSAAARSARPLVSQLDTFTSRAGPTATMLDGLLVNLRNRGAFEGLLKFVYSLSAAVGMYDGTGHIAGVQAMLPPCILQQSYPGCNANFDKPQPTPMVRSDQPNTGASAYSAFSASPQQTNQPTSRPPHAAAASSVHRSLSEAPVAPRSQPSSSTLAQLLNYLLR
jgi:virulence factor Mce-like protein